MKRTRVVVTGYSAITPLGLSAEESWRNLLAGVSGIGPITLFDSTDYPCRIAGEVKGFNPENFGIDFKAARRMARFAQLAVAAGRALLKHSHFEISDKNAARVGITLGVGLGGMEILEKFQKKLWNEGPSKVSPFYIPLLINNMAAGQLSIDSGAKGCNFTTTTACASGTHAIGQAYTEIVMNRVDAMLAGGVDACVHPLGIAGFSALKALCIDHNDDPEHASRPFDLNRSGFVSSEGVGLLLLESLESAQARGAQIYAEVLGFGASSDAYHMTAPDEAGDGMARSIKNALIDADVSPNDIDHVNAHGTSTHLNDLCETRAIKSVFGSHAYDLAITATKSQTGHALGAAGAIEAVFTVQTLHSGIVPGTANYETPDPECDLNYMISGNKKLEPKFAISNSFGFGGANGTIVLSTFN